MPNIKSAKKRVDVNERNRARNKSYKSELATGLKKYNASVNSGDKEATKKLLPETVSLIDESVTRGVIHKNKANRKKAEVNAKFAKMEEVKAPVEEKKEKKVKAEKPVEPVVEQPKAKRATRAKKAEASEATSEVKAEKTKAKKTTTKKAAAAKKEEK